MTLPTSAHLGTPAPTLESVAPDSASIDGRLDRLARGSAFGALLLLALALLALGFTSHHSDEALDAIARTTLQNAESYACGEPIKENVVSAG